MKLLISFLLGLSVQAADDPWAKIKALASGGEVRIVKKGTAQPFIAQLDETTNESIVVVLKNQQVAIPKEDILRIDYRPAVKGPKMVKETRTKTNEAPTGPKPIPGPVAPNGPSSSSSTSISSAPKGDFETVYRFVRH